MANGFSRHFGLFAEYNRWANHRLYGACGLLDDAEFRAPRLAFFGSILGTLNHILVADQTWLARLRGDSPPGYTLDQILCETLPTLQDARQRHDDEIAGYLSNLADADFAATISYQNTSGVAFENTVSDVLTHMFNHQTHHRGQVHNLLSQTDVAPPEVDLIFYVRELT